MKTWARTLGYAAGVLGAACLWLLLGSAPAQADGGPVTSAGEPDVVVDRAPTPVTEAVEEVPAVAEQALGVVRDVTAQALDAVPEVVAGPADPSAPPETDPAPAPTGPGGPEGRDLRVQRAGAGHDGPARTSDRGPVDRASESRSARPAPATAPVAAGVTTLVTGGSQAPVAPDDRRASDGSCTSHSGPGVGAVADTVDRLAPRPVDSEIRVVRPAEGAPAPPASPPGFSPD